MKKIKFNFYILSLVAVFGVSTSCTNDVDQNYPAQGDKPVATLSADKTSLLEMDDESTDPEDESLATYTLTASEAYKTDMKFKIEFLPNESTGSLNDIEISLDESPIDFGSAGFLVTILKNQLSTQFTIKSVFDLAVEQTETFKFRVYPVGDLNGTMNANSETFTFTIANSTSDSLKMILDWNGSGQYKGIDNAMHDLKDFDFDLEIYDDSFNIVSTSYNSSPESIEFMSSEADGMYYVVPSFWSMGGAVKPMLPINFNVMLTVAKPGIFVKEFDLSTVWNSTAGGAEEGNADAYNLTAYFIKTTNGAGQAMYELYDADDNLLVSGRMADLKSVLSAGSKAKAKAKAKK